MRSQAARRLRLAKLQSIPRPTLSAKYSSSSRQLQPRRPSDAAKIVRTEIDGARTPISEDAMPPEILELFTRRIKEVVEPHKRDPPVAEPEGSQTSQGGPPPDPGSEGDSVPTRRPKTRRIRLLADKEKESEPELPPRPTLHSDLISKIWWASPQSSGPPGDGEPSTSSPASHSEASASESSALDEGIDSKLPPPYILDEVEHKLRVILHPHAQKNGLRKPEDSEWRPHQPPVEPTLALFCPIEGGNHVIDATVQELSRRIDADVTVLDAVQLAAGLNGAYGEASSAFQFSPNPLHSAPPVKDSPATNGAADEEGSPAFQMMSAPSLSIQMPAISLGPFGEATMFRPSRNSPMSKRRTDRVKMRYFFDALLHAPSAPPEEGERRSYSRPRLIYIRDFEFLAASGSSWYPQLLRSIQQLRQGNDPSSDVVNQVAVVFGLSPALMMYRQPDSASPAAAALSSHLHTSPAPSEQEHGNISEPDRALRSTDEEEGAKLRERGIKSWLKDWDHYGEEAIRDELPWFDPFNMEGARGGNLAKAFGGVGDGVRVMGSIPNMPDLRDQISRMIRAVRGDPPAEESSEGDDSQYFSVAAVMPTVRQPELETSERLHRRKEINQLSFRMVLRNMGGIVPGQVDEYVLPRRVYSTDTAITDEPGEVEGDFESSDLTQLMFSEWESSLIDRETLREVAIRALGQSMATRVAEVPAKSEGSTSNDSVEEGNPSLTTVSWSTVALAWRQWFLHERQRKEWIAHQRRKSAPNKESRTANQDPSDDAGPEVDEVIERVKSDPTLDAHEKRLLGCIVDTTTVPTTFANVHLPVKTVDAIRTMVSLPLLYPKAFTEGVLKSHSMTGALLLGPPGVGKTLLARAVARESGARMLMVKPSDVMDMYVGEGEKLVKSVFSLARRLSPCVIFLDEVDALLASRISSRESGSAIAHRSVITEFMQEMDGLRTNKAQGNVIVIGATNRPFDLDDAVLRRLPRRLLIDLPGEKERLEILKIHLRDESLAPDVDLAVVAGQTDMYSGSDLKNLCVAAALDAVKESLQLPWLTDNKTPDQPSANENHGSRLLHKRHFAKALTEVTPSSSESLGTLHDLRKWNEEFGEGRVKSGGRKAKWGEKFGFGGKDSKDADGRVMTSDTAP